MANFHLSMRSGKKGKGLAYAQYITRKSEALRVKKNDDLITTCHGNLPSWCNDNPELFFATGDKNERSNAAVYKEFELSLPRELDRERQIRALENFRERVIKNKPFLLAIHEPMGAIGGSPQPHAHLMYTDRIPDEIDRPKEQFFRRYNPAHPARGGCKKDSGGKNPIDLAKKMNETRKTWADVINEELRDAGSPERVDHRSLREQGIDRLPEQYLGPAKVRKMSDGEKKEFDAKREKRSS